MRTLLLTLLIALALPSVAVAQVADALRSDPVYVDPEAELAGEIDADALRERIREEGAAPIYIAVVPGTGDPQQALRRCLRLGRGLTQRAELDDRRPHLFRPAELDGAHHRYRKPHYPVVIADVAVEMRLQRAAEQHLPAAVDRLAREVGRRDAPQRPLAERRDRGLLVRLPAQPALGLQALGDVAPDGEQHGAFVVVDDPQLISPTNSLPSRRSPYARAENRSGCSSWKYSAVLRS